MQSISGEVVREQRKIKDGGDIFSTFSLSLSLRCYSDHFVSSASGTLVIFGSWLLWQLVAAVSYSLTSHTVKIWSPQQHSALSKHSSSVYTNTRNNREGLNRGRMGATWEGITSTCLFFGKKNDRGHSQWLTEGHYLSRLEVHAVTMQISADLSLKGSYHACKSVSLSQFPWDFASLAQVFFSSGAESCFTAFHWSIPPLNWAILGSWENVLR